MTEAMHEAEKELLHIFQYRSEQLESGQYKFAIKAIIARYPQVLAEKVWEGEIENYPSELLDICYEQKVGSKIKVYIEVVS